ncbi:LytR family transcriptional regulator [Skermania sp. ID1734]|uniref:LCP family protein n=1 Tax=Skermania sp. ID1734 TaxID=2597516 RepID=UPI00117C4AFB|nr:LCP family protein [Skermania sp. ID1734]TSD97411.1 LytR family transcriptional regulator [Skermania sp. ID1734]
MAALAVLALVITGLGWHSLDSLRSNIAVAAGLGLGGADDGAVDILLVGLDSRTDAHGNPLSDSERAMLHAGDEVSSSTDTIILVRVPNNGKSATAISIPRDSYVNVPGIGNTKINAAYGATKEAKRLELVKEGIPEDQAEEEATKAGREALVKAVADLTGVTVDHYAEIGLLGFVLLTNAVGGVDVCLNNPVYEPLSGANFPAGEQTLNGPQALSFVRQRHDLPRGDLDRIVRQQVFMASLVRKVLSAKTLSDPSKLSQLSDAISRSVVLDSDWDILNFAEQLQDLAGGQVKFETIPVADINGETDDGESVVKVNKQAVRDYVASLADNSDSAAASVDPNSVTVDVANATDTDGLASRVSQALTDKGFHEGTVGNSTGQSVSHTEVLAASSDDAGAKAVADALGGVSVDADGSVPSGTVRVVLASDYHGPGSSDSSGTSAVADTSGATPAPPAPPISAGKGGPKCVN